MPKKMTRPTAKQQAFVKAKLENPGISNYQAAKEAGYSQSMAENAGTMVLESQGIKALMDKAGITDDRLIKVLDEGLESNKPSNAAILLTADGKTVKAEEQGLIEVADYPTRHKYLETALELKGHKTKGGVEVNVDARTQVLNMNVPDDELADFIKWRDEKRRTEVER